MQVIKQGDRWIARSSYEERALPKAAGFWWDPSSKVWWTQDQEKVSRLQTIGSVEQAQGVLAEKEQVKQHAISASKATDARIEVPVPDGLEYMPFQKAGIAYCQDKTGVLIADEPGLGKTIEAIGVINADPKIERVLVICPASLRINWRRELEKWLVRPLTVGAASGDEWPETQIVVINYDILTRHAPAISQVPWDLLVVDECHYLKNPKAKRTQMVLGHYDRKKKEWAVQPLVAKRRLFMTGTPIVNRPVELWPLANSLRPDVFRNFFGFAKRYCDAHNNGYGWDFTGASNLPELQEKLRSTCMVRRLKKDVLTELPTKRRQIIELPQNGATSMIAAENDAWSRHEDILGELQAAVSLADASDDPTAYVEAASRLGKARQVAFEDISRFRHVTAVAKCDQVIDHVRETLESVDKIVVFAHHHDVVERIMSGLSDYNPVQLTGETKMKDRQKAVDSFQNDTNVRVFVGSITAAGVGLTLTAASHVVFAELDWVPGRVSQAEDRCHRIGQTNSVLVQHLVFEKSLDARMVHTLVGKESVIAEALDNPLQVAEAVEVAKTLPAKSQPNLMPDQIVAAHEAVRRLAAACDGAQSLDGHGFNKCDTMIGHSLAACPSLTPRQAALAIRVCRKYKRQLGADLVARFG